MIFVVLVLVSLCLTSTLVHGMTHIGLRVHGDAVYDIAAAEGAALEFRAGSAAGAEAEVAAGHQ